MAIKINFNEIIILRGNENIRLIRQVPEVLPSNTLVNKKYQQRTSHFAGQHMNGGCKVKQNYANGRERQLIKQYNNEKAKFGILI